MIGYKGFNRNMESFNGFQYEVGKTYSMPKSNIKLGHSGFHYCRYPCDVFKYYDDPGDLYAKVKAIGSIIEATDKSVTNQITIIEILSKEQLIELIPNEMIRMNGNKEWYENAQLHREDGPAIESINGDKEWWIKGKRHRVNGPARELYNEHKELHTKEWYTKGQLHRAFGPAREGVNGYKEWWSAGLLHRLDGPAIEYTSGLKEWWFHGKRYK
jgi:hypothetical protein